ncbi:hypothetical protein D3C75_460630 [compost metagenome]
MLAACHLQDHRSQRRVLNLVHVREQNIDADAVCANQAVNNRLRGVTADEFKLEQPSCGSFGLQRPQHTVRYGCLNDRPHEALRCRVGGIPEHLKHPALLDDLALLHHGNLVADLLNDAHFMRNDQNSNRIRFIDFLKQFKNRTRRLRVQGRSGLIAQQN